MDKKRAIINIAVGIFFKIIVLIIAMITKSFVVRILGDEANGLYSLFTSILGFLAIAELGIGSAITFSLYKPIVEKDEDAISGLYYLYRKFYLIVFLAILSLGSIVAFFLPLLAKGTSGQINIYITYFVFLISVVITYLFAHKTSLINAFKDNYINTLITSISLVFEGVVQIIVIILTKNFLFFLLIRILSHTLKGIITEFVFRKKYKKYINNNKVVEEGTKQELFRNSKALFYYSVGSKLISTFDSIIISSLIGVVTLGLYSNYITIVSGMTAILVLMFTEINSILGQSYVKQDKEQYYKQFEKIYLINFIVGLVFYLGFISVGDSAVIILFGAERVMDKYIVLIVGINFFTQFARESVRLFKNASGQFHQDRFRPIIEGVLNLILSLILINFIGIYGILTSTIISKLVVTYFYEPLILFRDTFEKSPMKFYINHYSNVLLFSVVALILINLPIKNYTNVYLNILIKGGLSVLVSFLVIVLMFVLNKNIRNQIKIIISDVLGMIRKRKSK